METTIMINITLFVIISIFIWLFIILIYKLYKTEMKRRSYINNIKVGDKVWFSITDNIVNSVVEEIDGDNIKVSIVVNRKRLNPN
jgi:preprotein translocase subunit YajC